MESNESLIKNCAQPDCSFATTGICMENNGDKCQYLTSVLKDEVPIFNDRVVNTENSLYHLSPNREIEEENITQITYQYNSNVIVLLGDPECGKSTLYAAIFDRFQKGSCNGYFFAGTQTPIAFERRCHHARVISQNKTSKNERTYGREFVYLHLSVRDESLINDAKHLLFADVNGEKFQAARNYDDEMISLTVLKRAHQIFFIIDGESLVNVGKRHTVKADLIKLIGRALQNNMINKHRGINLLITKWDKVNEAKKEDDVINFIKPAIESKFGDVIKEIIKIASRSQNANVPAGSGLDDFLELCLVEKPTISYDYSDIFESWDSKRQFQKFKYPR